MAHKGKPRSFALPLEERFWAKVEKTETCWLWRGGFFSKKDGYGAILVGSRRLGDRRPRGVHRVSWEIHFGEIPDGMCVLHRCDVRLCVRPDHLFLGTHEDNFADMDQKGRRGRWPSCEKSSHRNNRHNRPELWAEI